MVTMWNGDRSLEAAQKRTSGEGQKGEGLRDRPVMSSFVTREDFESNFLSRSYLIIILKPVKGTQLCLKKCFETN